MATILMIDDDADHIVAMRTLLEAKGHRFHAAMSGEAGLKRVKEVSPDLIILDVMMARYTEGFHVTQKLRDPDDTSEYAAHRGVPILMLTSIHKTTPYRFAPDEDHLPVNVFLEKSAPIDRVLATIDELLEKAAAGR